MKSICCVLRSGGDFRPEHVEWLRRQCAEHMPDWTFRCWSDMDVPDATPLKTDWPRWWAKFEIYGTDFPGPALVIDLDTVFVRPLVIRPEHMDSVLVIRDPWRDGSRFPERLGGGFMLLPKWARDELRDIWMQGPEEHISSSGDNDQVFLHRYFSGFALRFQDHYIDEIVSYKVHVKGLGLQPENRVVYFHGTPRPWDAEDFWIPKLDVQQPALEIA